MAVKTATPANPYRLHLQAERCTMGAVEGEWRRANEELQMAEKLVAEGERMPVYITKFQNRVNGLAKKMQEIRQIPNLLLNSCQDAALRENLEIVIEIRNSIQQQLNAALRAVESAEENRMKIAGAVRTKLGPCNRIQANEEFDQSYLWAVRNGDELWINPNQTQMHQSNADYFVEQWANATRGIKIAKANRDSVSARSTEADEAVKKARQAMIDSPI